MLKLRVVRLQWFVKPRQPPSLESAPFQVVHFQQTNFQT